MFIREKLDYDTMYIFPFKGHQIYTQNVNKLTLSYLDYKRYIKENGINTYAWGHYKINSPSTSSSLILNLYREFMQDDDDEMFLNVNI